MTKPGQPILVLAGSLILAATAAFHATGYPDIAAWVDGRGEPSFFASAVPAIWLFPSLHWAAIAIALAVATWFRMAGLRPALCVIAALLVADAALVTSAVGPFVGSAMLIAAAMLYAIAAWREPAS